MQQRELLTYPFYSCMDDRHDDCREFYHGSRWWASSVYLCTCPCHGHGGFVTFYIEV